MSSGLTKYNFTITDQSPLFQYSPFRDGPISGGWNVTYPGVSSPSSSTQAPIGAGVSEPAVFGISS